MAGLRLIATRRFAVYGNTGDNGLGDRPALEQSSISSSTSRSAVRSYGVAAGMTFEKDGAEIEVPTMRLRELNKSNAARCVHFDRCCSDLAVYPCTYDLLPLVTDCHLIDSMEWSMAKRKRNVPTQQHLVASMHHDAIWYGCSTKSLARTSTAAAAALMNRAADDAKGPTADYHAYR